jgi:hypothetical protein
MSRSGFRSKPTLDFTVVREELNSKQFYLVAKQGPTVFKVKDEEGKLYICKLGDPNVCSCGADSSADTCIHMMYCLIKVLRIPDGNPLSWQTRFTDSQVDMALDMSTRAARGPRARRSGSEGQQGGPFPFMRRKEQNKHNTTAAEAADAEATVGRQGLMEDGENRCVVCQDDMEKDQALTWCRRGCGHNFHAKCMLMFGTHCKSGKNPVTCPLCREDWGGSALELIKSDARGGSSLKGTCSSVFCSACSLQQRGDFYRCVECSQASSLKTRPATPPPANRPTTGDVIGANIVVAPVVPVEETQPQQPSQPQEARCAPVDFCERCFTHTLGREHTMHHMLRADAGVEGLRDFDWVVVRNPRTPKPTMAPEVLQQMQERDLTDDDYDMLLNLDKEDLPEISDHLVDSFGKAPMVLPCGFCAVGGTRGAGRDSPPGCLLPCGHVVHEKCLGSKTTEALSDGGWKLQTIKCCIEGCKYPQAYLGLSRKRKKRRERSSSQTAETKARDAKAAAALTLEGCFGVSGLMGSISVAGQSGRGPITMASMAAGSITGVGPAPNAATIQIESPSSGFVGNLRTMSRESSRESGGRMSDSGGSGGSSMSGAGTMGRPPRQTNQPRVRRGSFGSLNEQSLSLSALEPSGDLTGRLVTTPLAWDEHHSRDDPPAPLQVRSGRPPRAPARRRCLPSNKDKDSRAPPAAPVQPLEPVASSKHFFSAPLDSTSVATAMSASLSPKAKSGFGRSAVPTTRRNRPASVAATAPPVLLPVLGTHAGGCDDASSSAGMRRAQQRAPRRISQLGTLRRTGGGSSPSLGGIGMASGMGMGISSVTRSQQAIANAVFSPSLGGMSGELR